MKGRILLLYVVALLALGIALGQWYISSRTGRSTDSPAAQAAGWN